MLEEMDDGLRIFTAWKGADNSLFRIHVQSRRKLHGRDCFCNVGTLHTLHRGRFAMPFWWKKGMLAEMLRAGVEEDRIRMCNVCFLLLWFVLLLAPFVGSWIILRPRHTCETIESCLEYNRSRLDCSPDHVRILTRVLVLVLARSPHLAPLPALQLERSHPLLLHQAHLQPSLSRCCSKGTEVPSSTLVESSGGNSAPFTLPACYWTISFTVRAGV